MTTTPATPVEDAEKDTGQPSAPSMTSEPSYSPPASQEAFDRIIGERLAREREKFSDYDAIKQQVADLSQQETEWKTRHDELQQQLEEATEKAASFELDSIRSQIAAESGFPAVLIAGSTREECEAQVAALAEHTGKVASQPTPWGSTVGKDNQAGAGVDPLHSFMSQT